MSKSERFKFGEITLPKASLPSSKDVYEAVKAMDKKGKHIGQQKLILNSISSDCSEKGRAAFLGDTHDEYSYCHFQYRIKAESRAVIAKKNGNHKKSETQSATVCSRVFYFENGQFAIESTRDEVDRRIPEFIGEITDTDTDGVYEFYETVPTIAESEAREHDLSNRVDSSNRENSRSGVRSGQHAPIDPIEDTEHGRASDGTLDANQATDIVDETAEKMRQLESGARDDTLTDDVFASGTVVTTWSEKDWPSDAETERRAETIREKIVPYLRRYS